MKNKVVVLLLLLVTLVFAAILVNIVISRPSIENVATEHIVTPTVQSNERESNSVVGYLTPANIETNANETFTVKLSFENLTTPLVAADIVLTYDGSMIEFVETTNLNPLYLLPRANYANNELTVSVVKKLNTGSSEMQSNMVSLVFKALKPGKLTVNPVLKQSGKTSMVYVENSDQDQLQSINSIFIKIK
jgi:hypothetical protein